MNNKILHTDVQRFIRENSRADIMSLLLKKPFFEGIAQADLVQQLEARAKCEKKLPLWFRTPNIYYPKKVNVEQSSSEKTAEFKARIIGGKRLADLTGGFGIDSYFFSKRFGEIVYCEVDRNLAMVVSHNFKVLDATNIKVVQNDGLLFLKDSSQHFDWIYIDPSRRNDTKGKVFKLVDCLPNIVEHLALLFSSSENILIKTSPLLDISAGLGELEHVSEVHIVAVDNEVKELLWKLQKGFNGPLQINTVNLGKERDEIFDFVWHEEKITSSELGSVKEYLYEPNAAILKAGAFKQIGRRFNLKKLHEHTHVYTSNNLIDFPGRRFRVVRTVDYNKKNIHGLGIDKANITTRNFPEKVVSIRKKFRIKDGGEDYLFFTTDHNENRVVLQCRKI